MRTASFRLNSLNKKKRPARWSREGKIAKKNGFGEARRDSRVRLRAREGGEHRASPPELFFFHVFFFGSS